MSSISVQIVMHGLIALAPIRGVDGTIQMNALAVDSRIAPDFTVEKNYRCLQHDIGGSGSHGTGEASHKVAVKFSSSDSQCTDVDECELKGGRCVCTLDRMEVSILPARSTTEVATPTPTLPRSLPLSNKVDDAGSFSYVPNLSLLGFRLNRHFLDPHPPIQLAARLRFPAQRQELTACELATRRDDAADNVHPLEFRTLGGEPQRNDVTQAGAQKVIAKFNLELQDDEHLQLELRSFDDPTKRHVFDLAPGTSIEFLNSRVDKSFMTIPMDRDDPCDDGIGRDFALFYELVDTVDGNPLPWGKRLVPHTKYTQWKAKVDINPDDACEVTKSLWSRPICPMASFDEGVQ